MLDKTIRAYIERELTQLDRLRHDYQELLLIRSDDGPELFERTALSAVVQSFYQGIEGVFQMIAKRIDEHMPSSADWHRQLLSQMTTATEVRPAVISDDLGQQLRPFLGFRHLARHNYPFVLDWHMMRELVEQMTPVLGLFQGEIRGLPGCHGPDRRKR